MISIRNIINRMRRLPRFQRIDNGELHFLIAAPRSGTTWLQTALNAHPDIYCSENRLFGNFVEIWPNNDGTESTRLTLDAVSKVYSGHIGPLLDQNDRLREKVLFEGFLVSLLSIERRLSGKSIIIDKITPYAGTTDIVLQGIDTYFPDAKIVRLVRDGRDVLVSGFFHWIKRTAEGRRLLASCESEKRLFHDDFIDAWAGMWSEINAGLSGFGRVVKTVRYEQLTADFESTYHELVRSLSIRSEYELTRHAKKSSSFVKMSGGRNRGDEALVSHVRKGTVGDWQRWFTRQDAERFWATAGNAMTELGYASGEEWIDELPDELSFRLGDVDSAWVKL